MTRWKWYILGICGLLLLASALASVLRVAQTAAPALAAGGERAVIILDPGHGGGDGGAVGVDGIVEKDLNLAIALTLRDLLTLNGFDVVMTREEDISIHDAGVTGTKKQKTSDLRNRLAMQGQYRNPIFISIHQNKFGDAKQNGTQVFYGPQNPGSALLAGTVQRNVVEMLQPENKRLSKKGEKNLFVIYEAKCPAIMVECGFLSNPAEAKKLMDGSYRSRLAFATLRSVIEYLEGELPGEGKYS